VSDLIKGVMGEMMAVVKDLENQPLAIRKPG
jgi:hypothetical protein